MSRLRYFYVFFINLLHYVETIIPNAELVGFLNMSVFCVESLN